MEKVGCLTWTPGLHEYMRPAQYLKFGFFLLISGTYIPVNPCNLSLQCTLYSLSASCCDLLSVYVCLCLCCRPRTGICRLSWSDSDSARLSRLVNHLLSDVALAVAAADAVAPAAAAAVVLRSLLSSRREEFSIDLGCARSATSCALPEVKIWRRI